MKVGTTRPEMGGLHMVVQVANTLHGERNAPELPIPTSAIRDYAKRFGLSEIFVSLVRSYDSAIMQGASKSVQEKAGGPSSAKTSQNVL